LALEAEMAEPRQQQMRQMFQQVVETLHHQEEPSA
jgi:exonuclease SbcD